MMNTSNMPSKTQDKIGEAKYAAHIAAKKIKYAKKKAKKQLKKFNTVSVSEGGTYESNTGVDVDNATLNYAKVSNAKFAKPEPEGKAPPLKKVVRKSKKVTSESDVLRVVRAGGYTNPFKWNKQQWFYDTQMKRISRLGTKSQPRRQWSEYQKRVSPYDYEPVYNQSTGRAYKTYPSGVMRATYTLVPGSKYPTSPGEFYDMLQVYFRRTFGLWRENNKGKATRVDGTKARPEWVTLLWMEIPEGEQGTYDESDTSYPTVHRELPLLAGKNQFIKNFNAISQGAPVAGSDAMPSGYQFDPSYFSFSAFAMTKKDTAPKGKGGARTYPVHEVFTFNPHTKVKHGDCALACVRSALAPIDYPGKQRAPFVTTLKKSIKEYPQDGKGLTLDQLQILEDHFDTKITVYAYDQIKEVLRDGEDRPSKRHVKLLYTDLGGEGHFMEITGERTPKKEKQKKVSENVIYKNVNWDCESYFNRKSQNVLKAYANAWHVVDDPAYFDEKPKECKVPPSEDGMSAAQYRKRQAAIASNNDTSPAAVQARRMAHFAANEPTFSPQRRTGETDESFTHRRDDWLKNATAECFYYDINDCACPIQEMLKWIQANDCVEIKGVAYKVKFKLVTYNGSAFDNFFLCDAASRMDMLSRMFYVNGRILDFTLRGGHKAFDLCKFVTCPLATACDNFKAYPRKVGDFSHKEIQAVFDKGGRDGLKEWLKDNREKVMEYNKFDVLSMGDILCKYRVANMRVLCADPCQFLTIGSMVWKTWKEQNEFDTAPPKTRCDDIQIRRSMTAGRTQAFFGVQWYRFAVRAFDVCSLYPHVMTGEQFRYPVGQYKYTDKYMPGKLGIYRCDIAHQRVEWKNPKAIKESFATFDAATQKRITPEMRRYAPTILPRRFLDKHGKADITKALDWQYRGAQRGVYMTSVDYEMIKKHAGDDAVSTCKGWEQTDDNGVKTSSVYHGIYWEEDTNKLFSTFLGKLAIEKNKQDELKRQKSPDYNEALREAVKLASNNISGKPAERCHEDVAELLRTSKDINEFYGKQDDKWVFDEDGEAHHKKVSTATVKDATINYITPNLCMGQAKKLDAWGDGKNASPSYIACFIYSHARSGVMYEALLCRYIALYMDTDSCFINAHDTERLKKEQPEILPGFGVKRVKKYGDLEEELGNADNLLTIAAKFYCAYNEEEERSGVAKDKKARTCDPKKKCKGLKYNDKYIVLENFPTLQEEMNKPERPKSYRETQYSNKYQNPLKIAMLKRQLPSTVEATKKGGTVSDFCEAGLETERQACDIEMFQEVFKQRSGGANNKSVIVFSSQLVKGVQMVHEDKEVKFDDFKTSAAHTVDFFDEKQTKVFEARFGVYKTFFMKIIFMLALVWMYQSSVAALRLKLENFKKNTAHTAEAYGVKTKVIEARFGVYQRFFMKII